MQRLAIDKIRQYFPSLSAQSAGRSRPADDGESAQDIIDRKTKAFLAEGGEVESVPEGKTNFRASIQITIGKNDQDRRREAKRKTYKKDPARFQTD
jgi:hypothetical protein